MSTPIKDITGMEVGKLTVLKLAPKDASGRTKWICQCECGNQTTVMRQALMGKHTRSCGYLISFRPLPKRERHGQSHRKKEKASAEYVSWKSMRNRCTNPSNDAYEEYGGRGITVCSEWDSFEQFLADMGPKPEPSMSIERIKNNKGYGPENCKWATRLEQNNNKRNTKIVQFRGERITLRALSQITGFRQETLYWRIFTRGWAVEYAATEPIQQRPIKKASTDHPKALI